jgi:hypothetical protein
MSRSRLGEKITNKVFRRARREFGAHHGHIGTVEKDSEQCSLNTSINT